MLMGSSKVLFMRIIQIVLTAVISILLARVLGASSYGDYILVLTITSTLVIPVQFGMSQLIIRETSRLITGSADLGPFYSWALRVTLKWSAVVLFALTVGLTLLHHPPQRNLTDLIIVSGAMLVVINLLFFFAAILAGLKQIEREQFLQNVLRPFVFLALLVIIIIALGHEAMTGRLVFFVNLVSVLLVAGLLAVAVTRQVSIPLFCCASNSQQSKWLRVLVSFMMIGGIDVLLQSSDILMLGAITASEDVGIYKIGAVIAGLMSLPLSAASTYASPRIAAASTVSQIIALQSSCIYLARVSFAVTLIFLLTAIFFGRFAIETAYGKSYTDAFTITMFLGFGSTFNVMMGLNRAVLTMNGLEAVVFRVMGWSALFNIVLNAFFIVLFGAVGAAAATSATIVIWNIWLHFESRRALGYSVAIFSKLAEPTELKDQLGKGLYCVR